MNEWYLVITLCIAYNALGLYGTEVAMETYLYHEEYEAINEDLQGNHPIDDVLYYGLFGCDL